MPPSEDEFQPVRLVGLDTEDPRGYSEMFTDEVWIGARGELTVPRAQRDVIDAGKLMETLRFFANRSRDFDSPLQWSTVVVKVVPDARAPWSAVCDAVRACSHPDTRIRRLRFLGFTPDSELGSLEVALPMWPNGARIKFGHRVRIELADGEGTPLCAGAVRAAPALLPEEDRSPYLDFCAAGSLSAQEVLSAFVEVRDATDLEVRLFPGIVTSVFEEEVTRLIFDGGGER
jgi:hypothetical protein